MKPFEPLLESDSFGLHESETWSVRAPSDLWQFKQKGIWLNVTTGQPPQFGWKIHVSSTLADAPTVLKRVSEIAFEAECSFKYLVGVDAFLLLHFKNANRLQSGKFIALYPTTEVAAATLLNRLRMSLRQYTGLDVLTDRAYKGSSNVFYRWGAFHSTGRLNGDGAPEELVPNGKGQLVPDLRLPRFELPEGIVDPFTTEPIVAPQSAPQGSVSLDQFIVDSVLRFTNAGGRYKGICQVSGSDVVVKEARPHTGFVGNESAIPRLHREVAVMNKINAAYDRLAPTVLKTFAVQDHEYVALEYLPGTPLSEWIARENPLYSCLYLSPQHVREYLERASKILKAISSGLQKLHSLGVAYGDLSLGNIIVDKDDGARFIDFEACTSVDDVVPGLRTPDFCLLHQDGKLTAKDRDLYAYHCIAISLVLRLTTLAEISDHVLRGLSEDLIKVSHELPQWWCEACTHLKAVSQQHSAHKVSGFSPPSLDTPASRARLRELISNAALDCYTPGTDHLFPTSTAARKGAFLSFGFGCSGLLGALKLNGTKVDDEILLQYSNRLAVAIEGRLLPINYDVGFAGMLDVCLAYDLEDIYERILEIMLLGWANVTDPSLATGLTGISLAFRRHGYAGLAEEVMARAIQMAKGHQWKKNGLLYGRSGVVAGACQFDSLLSSQTQLSNRVREIIGEEFGQLVRHPKGNSLSLRGEIDGSRLLPYLCDGTAGLLLALIFADKNEHIDFSLGHEDVIALSADLGTPFMLEGSLMDGAAGLAITLELSLESFPEIADRIPAPRWDRIQKYFLPLGSGLGVLHPRSLKFDLSHSQGSIGILEALLWVDGIAELNLSGLYLPPKTMDVPKQFSAP